MLPPSALYIKDVHTYSKVEIRYWCLRATLQAGINLLQDKEAWIKSSRKAIESSREHQRFADVPLGRYMSIDRKCWVGTCLRSPIQWNWFHPATPRSWDLLISQVWNCSERSSSRRRRVSGSRGKDEKVKLKLGDICCMLLLQSIRCHKWK